MATCLTRWHQSRLMTTQGHIMIFPIELIEAVIDHLHSDKKSLKCVQPGLQGLDKSCSVPSFHLPEPLQIERLPTLARCLSTQVLESRSPMSYVTFVSSKDSGTQTRIHGMTLFHGSLASTTSDIATSPICLALVGQFAHIVDLRLVGVEWPSFASFSDVIRAFSSLETLGPKDNRWSNSMLPAQSLSLPRNFHALELTGPRNGLVLQWLLSLHAIPALHTLYLYDGDFGDREITINMLKALSPFLEALVVAPWIDYCSLGMSVRLAFYIDAIRPG